MKASKLHRRWQKRFREYNAAIRNCVSECRETGDAESIHQLRVALRRCRLLAGLASFIIGKERLGQFRRETGQLLDALGRVRDLDIALDWLRRHGPDEKTSKAIARRRGRLWNQARLLLDRAEPGAWERLPDARANTGEQRRLKKRHTRLIEKLGNLRGFIADFRHLSAEQWHELRRAVRRWRYLRELVLSRGDQQKDRLLQAVLRFQEALGGAQDRVVVETALTHLRKPRLVRRLLPAVRQERRHLTVQAHRLLEKMVRLDRHSTSKGTSIA